MSEQPTSLLGSLLQSKIVAAASIAAAAFVGYCIYFDHKRRSDPNYKQKIRQNRRAAANSSRNSNPLGSGRSFPNLNDPTAMQAFFLQEVQLGEELMGMGNIEEGAEHLCNSIVLCGQPQQLLQVFQSTLPPEAFSILMQKLPEARQRLGKLFGAVEFDDSAGQAGTAGHPAEGAQVERILDLDDLE